MTITELLHKRNEINKQVAFLENTLKSGQILIRTNIEMWVDSTRNPRLFTSLVEVLDKELTHLFEESLSINLKIDAINTLLSQD